MVVRGVGDARAGGELYYRGVRHGGDMVDDDSRPSFAAPPVVEVVLSVGFNAIPGLGSVQLAGLREEYRRDFPDVDEQPPYFMPMESFGKPQMPTVSMELFQTPPAPRLWFVDKAGSQLVQVQNNWFARNWRKAPDAPDYPRYPRLRDAFVSDLERYQGYVRREGLPDIQPNQCEVTYINHIEFPAAHAVGNLGSILTMVTDRPRGLDMRPESQQLAAQYVISEDDGPLGRLHIQANPARRVADATDIVVLNITARGRPIGEGIEGVLRFQNVGRRWANRAFVGVTRASMHEKWRIQR